MGQGKNQKTTNSDPAKTHVTAGPRRETGKTAQALDPAHHAQAAGVHTAETP